MTEETFHQRGSELRITIRSLHAQGDGAEVMLRITLESGEHREERRLLLTTEQYCELKPCRGEISEEFFETLESAAELCAALRCGENLLSFSANSVQLLTQKLMRRGFSRDVAAAAAERLAEMGFINEAADLRREVEKCLRKLWGAKRIGSHLWSRGFGSKAMATLPALLEEIDFSANCAALIRRHYVGIPTDPDEHRRMVASLSRYGYTLTEIRSAIAKIEQA